MAWRRELRADLPIIDEPTIRRLRNLMADVAEDGEDLARDLLDTFRVDVDRRLSAFDEALRQDDRDEAAEAVHALKGASATVGAMRVSTLCAAVEIALKGGDHVHDATAAIRQEAAAALIALQEALQRRRNDCEN